MSDETIRTFIAIPVNYKKIEKSYAELRQSLLRDKIKWVDPFQFHLTLQFIGNTPVELIDEIKAVVESLNWEHTAIRFNGLSYFVSKGLPRVLFVKTKPNEVLQQLQVYVHNELSKLIMLKEENREYVPHLTLGRIKFVKNKEYFFETIKQFSQKFEFESELDKVVFYKSTLTPEGPVYEELAVIKK